LNTIGCNDLSKLQQPAHQQETVIDQGGTVTSNNQEENVSAPNSSVSSDTNQSTQNTVLYQVNDWVVGAGVQWQSQTPPLDQVKLFLVNKEESLLFLLLVEEIKTTDKEYVDSQVEHLKKMNLTRTTLKQTTINDVSYYLIESPDSNFNNWQWIHVDGKTAYVWGCGGPKESNVNFEKCLTLMTTVQK
jgi:hypothetical protein